MFNNQNLNAQVFDELQQVGNVAADVESGVSSSRLNGLEKALPVRDAVGLRVRSNLKRFITRSSHMMGRHSYKMFT